MKLKSHDGFTSVINVFFNIVFSILKYLRDAILCLFYLPLIFPLDFGLAVTHLESLSAVIVAII